jgi:ElaB/YqjD/DUF883 family membrane-anchored ribosome-binding protein
MARQQKIDTSSAKIRQVEKDLQNLRDEFSHLAKSIEAAASDTGGNVIGELKNQLDQFSSAVDEAIANAGARGREAVHMAGEVSDNIIQNVEDTVRERPLMTLAVAAGLGFILSAVLRR